MLTADPVQADPDSQRMLKYDWWSKYTCSVQDKLQKQEKAKAGEGLQKQQQQKEQQKEQQQKEQQKEQEEEQDDYKKDQRDMLDVS